jgi:hypothetical protein
MEARHPSGLQPRLIRAQTDKAILELLPKWYALEHLRDWAAPLPRDPATYSYRGAFLTPDQLLQVLEQGFSARRSHFDEIYFTADPAEAISYALPSVRLVVDQVPERGVVVVFQVAAERLSTPGKTASHRTAGYRKNVPAKWFTGVWILDPHARDDRRRFVKL